MNTQQLIDDFATYRTKFPPQHVKALIKLLESGNTIPFICRYRKEATGGLDETQLREINDQYEKYIALNDRRKFILTSIEKQGKLTDGLKERIQKCTTLTQLEDLYLPWKQKRKTLANTARQLGLEPVAKMLHAQLTPINDFLGEARKFIKSHKDLKDLDEVLKYVTYIVAEWISENVEVREELRLLIQDRGVLASKKAKGSKTQKKTTVPPKKKRKTGIDYEKYRNYFEYSQPVKNVPSHRVLALNRGEAEKALSVSVEIEKMRALAIISGIVARNTPVANQVRSYLDTTIQDSYKRLLFPSLEREARKILTAKAHDIAIEVFAENLRKLMLTRPVSGKILGIDPGFISGSKLAAIDETGMLLEDSIMYPHPPQRRIGESKNIIRDLVMKHSTQLIAIGNGTASRETEKFVSDFIKESRAAGSSGSSDFWNSVRYTIVSEAGASVYSASKEAIKEFPKLDASQRGTVSIARRLQDPLAELVKIDPKAVGVGLYQHDMAQKKLTKSVDSVVESCVNFVGVDLNTCSDSLLRHCAGLSSRQALNIVQHRDKNGKFETRADILKVKGVGKKTFEQAAGFLMIPHGSNILDNTLIHPESYKAAQSLLEKVSLSLDTLKKEAPRFQKVLQSVDVEKYAKDLKIGIPTLTDIVDALQKPGRDPRVSFPEPVFRNSVKSIEDLKEGDVIENCAVRNCVPFGAYLDIGVGKNGLLHISEMCDRFITSPADAGISTGMVLTVKVVNVDLQRSRIGLSIKNVNGNTLDLKPSRRVAQTNNTQSKKRARSSSSSVGSSKRVAPASSKVSASSSNSSQRPAQRKLEGLPVQDQAHRSQTHTVQHRPQTHHGQTTHHGPTRGSHHISNVQTHPSGAQHTTYRSHSSKHTQFDQRAPLQPLFYNSGYGGQQFSQRYDAQRTHVHPYQTQRSHPQSQVHGYQNRPGQFGGSASTRQRGGGHSRGFKRHRTWN